MLFHKQAPRGNMNRIYIVYDYDQNNKPINVNLWWRQPPRFFYDSKTVSPEFFGYEKLVLTMVKTSDNGETKYDFAYLSKSKEYAIFNEKKYSDRITNFSYKKIVEFYHLELDVNG